MLQSGLSIIDGCAILDLEHQDIQKGDYLYLFTQEIIRLKKNRLIFNLENLEIVTSDDIDKIEKIIDALSLSGVESIVCGFNPYSAAVLFSFVDNINFKTSLDIKGALDAFSNQ